MWRRLRTRVLLEHPRLTIVEDDVLLPDDTATTYLRFDSRGGYAVTALCRRDDGSILLQREYSYPPNEQMLQLPGGGANAGEDPVEATNRELMEESGYRATRLTRLGDYYLDNRRTDARMLVFLAEDLVEESLPPDPGESIENLWVPEAEVDRLIAAGEIRNYALLAAWAFYRARDRV